MPQQAALQRSHARDFTCATHGVSNAPQLICGVARAICNPTQPKLLDLSPRLDASFTKVFPGAQPVLPKHREFTTGTSTTPIWFPAGNALCRPLRSPYSQPCAATTQPPAQPPAPVWELEWERTVLPRHREYFGHPTTAFGYSQEHEQRPILYPPRG